MADFVQPLTGRSALTDSTSLHIPRNCKRNSAQKPDNTHLLTRAPYTTINVFIRRSETQFNEFSKMYCKKTPDLSSTKLSLYNRCCVAMCRRRKGRNEKKSFTATEMRFLREVNTCALYSNQVSKENIRQKLKT